MTTARALLLTCLFAAALPAGAQYYPPPPPPPGPPPSPPGGPPAYPPYAPPRGASRLPPRYVLPDPAPTNTVRVGLGFTFANEAYDCWYYGDYYYGYSCGSGYGGGVAWPNLNVEADIGLSHAIALTLGGNVFGGDWNGVSNTVFEPHVDVMFRSSPYSDVRGRLRLGLGLYAATADAGALGGSRSQTGGAFRVGVGGSFFARSRLGLGIDAIFEAGSIGGYYVSTLQLMIGPEFHF